MCHRHLRHPSGFSKPQSSVISASTSTTMTSQQQPNTAPWHAAYPVPEHQPGSLTRDEVLKWMKEAGSVAEQDFVLVDLRRNDHEVSLSLRTLRHPPRAATVPLTCTILRAARFVAPSICLPKAYILQSQSYTAYSRPRASVRLFGIAVRRRSSSLSVLEGRLGFGCLNSDSDLVHSFVTRPRYSSCWLV